MAAIEELLRGVPLPQMVRVRQQFGDTRVRDVEAALIEGLAKPGALGAVHPGMSVAVTLGSRGIRNLLPVTQTVVRQLQQAGARPFGVAAMGSHGGATAEGQLATLHGLGLTEEAIGCPIVSSMEVRKIGRTAHGRPVYIDAHAAKADGIVAINRVKPNTSFTGEYESGLFKMLAVGLGKQAGAAACHREGHAHMAENVQQYGQAVLKHAKVLFGVALVENERSHTCHIEAVPGAQIAAREPALLRLARTRLPRLLFGGLDVLVVDKMGKDISGLGIDPHVTGCFASPYASGPPRPGALVVLDMTPGAHGNATGLGVADVTTQRLAEKVDAGQTYPNALTAALAASVRVPMAMPTAEMAVQAGIVLAGSKEQPRLVRIQDTLHLDEIWVSTALLPEVEKNRRIQVLGVPTAWPVKGCLGYSTAN